MDILELAPIIIVLCLGAISPGPSLVVLLRNTIEGGRRRGVLCGIGHGIGFGIYALFAITGIAFVKSAGGEKVSSLLEIMGAFFLIFLSYSLLKPSEKNIQYNENTQKGFLEGFLIAFLNPKILAFLVAIFSQFIEPEFSWFDRLLIALIALIIDGGWYIFVAIAVTGTSLIEKLQSKQRETDVVMGILLSTFAVWILYHAMQ